MLKKTIKYTDFDDVEREEDFYFNLTKAELMEMQLGQTGGLEKEIRRIVQTKDVPAIMDIFKRIILAAYGEKSADGRQFLKLDANGNKLSVGFSQTAAFSELYTELATNDAEAAKFINGIIPRGVQLSDKELEEIKSGKDIEEVLKDKAPKQLTNND